MHDTRTLTGLTILGVFIACVPIIFTINLIFNSFTQTKAEVAYHTVKGEVENVELVVESSIPVYGEVTKRGIISINGEEYYLREEILGLVEPGDHVELQIFTDSKKVKSLRIPIKEAKEVKEGEVLD